MIQILTLPTAQLVLWEEEASDEGLLVELRES